MQEALPDVVAMVRAEIAREPTPRALYRAQLASDDGLTRQVAERSEDRDYASAFGKACSHSLRRLLRVRRYKRASRKNFSPQFQ
jgi:hypothetical protein